MEMLFYIIFGTLICLPVPLTAMSLWYKFCTRKQYPQLTLRLYTWNWDWDDYIDDDNDFLTGVIVWIVSAVVLSIAGAILEKNYMHITLNGLLMTGLVIVLLASPRYIIDLVKALRYNNKTGKADELESLKQRLLELENKQ